MKPIKLMTDQEREQFREKLKKETQEWLEKTDILFIINNRMRKAGFSLHEEYAKEVFETYDVFSRKGPLLTEIGKTQGTE